MRRFASLVVVGFLTMSMVPVNVFALEDGTAGVDSELVVASDSIDVNMPIELPVSDVPSTEAMQQAGASESIESPAALAEETPLVAVEPQPPRLPASPILVTSYRIDDGRLSFVQLYNNSSSMVVLDDWQVLYTISSPGEPSATMPIQLSAWLLPHQYAVFGQVHSVAQADAEYDMPLPSKEYSVTGIQVAPPDSYTSYVVPGSLFTEQVRYDLSQSAAGNYISTSKFQAVDTTLSLYGGGLYTYPLETAVRVVEVVAHSRDCSPLEQDVACGDYVKLFNPTPEAISLDTLRLRIGYQGQTSSIANTVPLQGDVPGGSYVVIALRSDGQQLGLPNSGGYVWLEDYYGLKRYDQTVQEYTDASASSRQGQSWALDTSDGNWKWGIPMPNGPNVFPEVITVAAPILKPCAANQYRSEETNRCRAIVVASVLTPCKNGQYRSEETNRCRSIALAGSTLTPCKDNQYRSEATNRCRSVLGASTHLVPCKDNQYRSEETNRCRTVAASAIPDAAFAVTPVKETGKAFIGWWALGGVGLLAVGYGAWEWRREMMSVIRKTGSLFRSGK